MQAAGNHIDDLWIVHQRNDEKDDRYNLDNEEDWNQRFNVTIARQEKSVAVPNCFSRGEEVGGVVIVLIAVPFTNRIAFSD